MTFQIFKTIEQKVAIVNYFILTDENSNTVPNAWSANNRKLKTHLTQKFKKRLRIGFYTQIRIETHQNIILCCNAYNS